MLDILKAEFNAEVDFLDYEIIRLSKLLEEESEEVDDIEERLSKYRTAREVATKYEESGLRDHLMSASGLTCPRCLIRTDTHVVMSPVDSYSCYDIFACKKCGWEFEAVP